MLKWLLQLNPVARSILLLLTLPWTAASLFGGASFALNTVLQNDVLPTAIIFWGIALSLSAVLAWYLCVSIYLAVVTSK